MSRRDAELGCTAASSVEIEVQVERAVGRLKVLTVSERLTCVLRFKLLWLLGICFVCGGATCARKRTISEFAPPNIFQQTPSFEELSHYTNRSLAIERIESNTLTITSPDFAGKLNGTLQWERPHNFNLQAYMGSRLMGTVLAAGSNADEFWLQTQGTLYRARHDEFEAQTGPRHILPVSPLWLREALGIVEFDPTFEHEGPLVRTDGRLEVRSLIPSPRGSYRRVLVFAPSTGTVEETLLYDQTGKMVASAQQSQHEYYSAINSSLPHHVIVQLQPDQGPGMSFTIEVGFYLLNQAPNAQSNAFVSPDPTGLLLRDLVNENAQMGQAAAVQPVYRSTSVQPYADGLQGFRR